MPFSTKNPPVRFEYQDDNGPTGEWVEVRVPSLDIIKQVKKATTKQKREFKDGFTYQYDEVNEDKYEEMLWDKVIVNWHLIDGESSTDIPCDPANKKLMMNNCPEFSKFILESLEKLKAGDTKYQEAVEKN